MKPLKVYISTTNDLTEETLCVQEAIKGITAKEGIPIFFSDRRSLITQSRLQPVDIYIGIYGAKLEQSLLTDFWVCESVEGLQVCPELLLK
jgi:hypothetical protein